MVELVTKLEHHALGGFLADAGNARERTDVVALDRGNHRVRRRAAQDRDRQPGPDAADTDELLKELLLVAMQKAKKRERIFAHVRVDKHRHFCSQRGQCRKSGNADVDFVSDARGLDDDLVGMFGDQLPAKMGDHALLLTPRSKQLRTILLNDVPTARLCPSTTGFVDAIMLRLRPRASGSESRRDSRFETQVQIWADGPTASGERSRKSRYRTKTPRCEGR